MATKKRSTKTSSKKMKARPAPGKKQLTKGGNSILLTRSGDPIVIGGGGG